MAVLIIGAGPAGLRTATEVAWDIPDPVLVLERDDAPGGSPRTSAGWGFGRRDIYRLLSGPRYAAQVSKRARRAGAEILLHTTVTGWAGPHAVHAVLPDGECVIEADVIVLATGATGGSPRRVTPASRPAPAAELSEGETPDGETPDGEILAESPAGEPLAGASNLASLGGLALDEVTGWPLVDSALRTDRQGVFAIGDLARPVGGADCAALDGLRVRQPILDYLAGRRPPSKSLRLRAGAGLGWIAPGIIRGDEPPTRGYLLAGCEVTRRMPKVVARQGETVIGWRLLPWSARPDRVFRIPWNVIREASHALKDVTISIE